MSLVSETTRLNFLERRAGKLSCDLADARRESEAKDAEIRRLEDELKRKEGVTQYWVKQTMAGWGRLTSARQKIRRWKARAERAENMYAQSGQRENAAEERIAELEIELKGAKECRERWVRDIYRTAECGYSEEVESLTDQLTAARNDTTYWKNVITRRDERIAELERKAETFRRQSAYWKERYLAETKRETVTVLHPDGRSSQHRVAPGEAVRLGAPSGGVFTFFSRSA